MTRAPRTEPLVSIIIPCFNGDTFVSVAIRSALEQTYRYKEVIVIDDGSTDRSLEIIRSFGAAIRWDTGPNRGGGAARNRGLELASGELIQFLDADDALDVSKLERQIPVSLLNPDAVVYCDHWLYEAPNCQQPVLRSRGSEERDPVVFVLRHHMMTTIAPLHRREWLTEVRGFREGLPASQEFDLHLRLAAAGRRFVHLPEPLFTVCRHPRTVSSDTGCAFAAVLEFLPEIVSTIASRGELTTDRRREFAAYMAKAGRLCLRYGQKSAGLELLAHAAALDGHAADRAAYGSAARAIKRAFGSLAVERLSHLRRMLNGLPSRPA